MISSKLRRGRRPWPARRVFLKATWERGVRGGLGMGGSREERERELPSQSKSRNPKYYCPSFASRLSPPPLRRDFPPHPPPPPPPQMDGVLTPTHTHLCDDCAHPHVGDVPQLVELHRQRPARKQSHHRQKRVRGRVGVAKQRQRHLHRKEGRGGGWEGGRGEGGGGSWARVDCRGIGEGLGCSWTEVGLQLVRGRIGVGQR